MIEELLLSKKTKDIKVFSREDSQISVKGDFFVKGLNDSFIDALDRLVRPDMLLLTFLGKYYPKEIPMVADAYRWFGETLNIVRPQNIHHLRGERYGAKLLRLLRRAVLKPAGHHDSSNGWHRPVEVAGTCETGLAGR